MSKFTVEGKELREFEVKESGNSGHVIVPKKWIGCKVLVVRVD